MAELRVPDLNYVILAGRVVTDPEIRAIGSGRYVTRFRLANNRRYKVSSGEYKNETLFIDVVVWDRQAEYVKQHCKKGRPLIVEGRLRFDEWESRIDGLRRSKLEIVAQRVSLLDFLPSEQGAEEIPPSEVDMEVNGEIASGEPIPEDNWDTAVDDDVPF